MAVLLALLLAGCAGGVRQAAGSEAPHNAWQSLAHDASGTPEPASDKPAVGSAVIPWPAINPSQSLHFDRYSIEAGLSQSVANAMLQDRQGFLWIGTEDGLNRFDGYDFTVYRADPADALALSNSHILDLTQDAQGAIWLGTYGGGLNQLDPATGTFHHFRHAPNDPASLSDDQVEALWIGQDGALWIGTLGGGLDRLDPGGQRFIHHRHDPARPASLGNDDVYAVLEDRSGALWVGHAGGLDRLAPGASSFTHYRHDPQDPDSLPPGPVQSLLLDASDRLWIGTAGGGLARYRSATDDFADYPSRPGDVRSLSSGIIYALAQDPSGWLWVGTEVGLDRLDPSTGRMLHVIHDPANPRGLGPGEVRSLLLDQSGGLWVGTYGGGLSRLDPRRLRFAHYTARPGDPNSLSRTSIWSIYRDRSGILWIGTDGSGLDRFDRKANRWDHFRYDPYDENSLSNDTVTAIFQDRFDALWIGTSGGGLNRFNRFERSFERFQYDPQDPGSLSGDVVWFIREDQSGALWVGTSNGLNRFDRTTGDFQRYQHDPEDPTTLADSSTGSFYQDREGRIWVGTHEAFHRFDPETGQFIRYQHDPADPTSISHNIVFAMHEDRAGRLWLGTWGGGLNRLDPETGHFAHYRMHDGLPNDVVYGILEDERGRLWLSTNGGLSCFDPEDETFVNFDVDDGLQSNEFSYNAYFKDPDGELFFGGINGFNAFFPGDIAPASAAPQVILTSLSHDGQPADPDQPLVVEWPGNSLEFEFAALTFYQSEENQYAYLLEGFDEDWNYVEGLRFGRYTNLPGGEYTLRIKAANSEGVWNEAAISYPITVLPPIWATWWFRSLAVLLVGAASFASYRFRVSRVEARTRALEQQIRERTHSLEQRGRDLERRRKELEALYRADEKLLSRLDLDAVLQALVDTAVDILEADKGSVLVWDPRLRKLSIRASKGFHPSTLEHMRFASGEGLAGIVFASGVPTAVEDAANDPRTTKAIIEPEGIRAILQVPIKVGEEIYGVFSADYTRPRRFDEETQRLLVSLANHAAIAIENARLYEAEQRRGDQFHVLLDTGSRLTSILSPDELRDQISNLVRGTLGYYQVSIGLIEGDEVVFRSGAGLFWDLLDREPLRLKIGGRSLSSWVVQHGEPLLVPDVRRDPRYFFLPSDSETKSELVVPLRIKDKVIGVLAVSSDQLDAFDQSDVAVLQSLADQSAIAIENARLYAQAGEAAASEERTRLARELHDAVTQTLFSASLIAEALPSVWEEDRSEGSKLLQELRQLNRGALAEMRSLLMELRPAALEEAWLGDLMRQLAAAVSGRSGLTVRVHSDGECELPRDVHLALYRIAQEALNNVVKHAGACDVEVALSCIPAPQLSGQSAVPGGRVELRVSDSGAGFDPQAVAPECLGLEIIRERARTMGATLDIESQRGNGTTIVVRWEG